MRSVLKKLHFVPKMFLLMGALFLFPLFMLLPYPQEHNYIGSFLVTTLVSIFLGILLQLRYQFFPGKQRAGRQNAVISVMLLWGFIMLLGGLPFVLGGQLQPVKALFESVSGWTTTGFTTYANLDAAPHIFLFYRAFMQFCGGLGFVLLLLFFSGGREAMSFFYAEGHSDMLEPNLVSTARYTMLIYLGMVLGGTGLYILFDMHWFEALNHSMSALGTGGFSPRNENIGAYHSVAIEAVTIILMLLGATNFAALSLMLKRKWRSFLRLGDIRFFSIFMGAAVVLLAFLGLRGVYASFGESFRNAIFLAVSAVTTTGYSIDSINDWSPAMIYIIFILMFVGGASGSTSGGIKYTRVYILCKSFAHHLRSKLRPEKSVNMLAMNSVNGKIRLDDAAQTQHMRVALLYLVSFFLGAFLLTLDGMPLEDAFYEFASSLGTIGLSNGPTGPNANNYVLIVQMFGMILARMEVYIVYVFFAAGLQQMLRRLRRAGRKVAGRNGK